MRVINCNSNLRLGLKRCSQKERLSVIAEQTAHPTCSSSFSFCRRALSTSDHPGSEPESRPALGIMFFSRSAILSPIVPSNAVLREQSMHRVLHLACVACGLIHLHRLKIRTDFNTNAPSALNTSSFVDCLQLFLS